MFTEKLVSSGEVGERCGTTSTDSFVSTGALDGSGFYRKTNLETQVRIFALESYKIE